MPKRKRSSAPSSLIPVQRIESRIYLIRGQKVLLSHDLAELYGVATKQLNRAVARNRERFPPDFMFRLTREEDHNLRSQFGTSSQYGGRRYLPYAFTEQGVAMLSAVLRSPTAVGVSIQIMRAFVRLRRLLSSHHVLRRKLDAFEKKLLDHDQQFAVIFDAIRQLMDEPDPPPTTPDRLRIRTRCMTNAGRRGGFSRRSVHARTRKSPTALSIFCTNSRQPSAVMKRVVLRCFAVSNEPRRNTETYSLTYTFPSPEGPLDRPANPARTMRLTTYGNI